MANFDGTAAGLANIRQLWSCLTALIKKLIGDVDLTKGDLQTQIDELKKTVDEGGSVLVAVHGAAFETVTLSDGINAITCETDANGVGTATVKVGNTYKLTGSVSGYTQSNQLVTSNTTDLYAMPTDVKILYWHGATLNRAGGWTKTPTNSQANIYITYGNKGVVNTNTLYYHFQNGKLSGYVCADNNISPDGYAKCHVRFKSYSSTVGTNSDWLYSKAPSIFCGGYIRSDPIGVNQQNSSPISVTNYIYSFDISDLTGISEFMVFTYTGWAGGAPTVDATIDRIWFE